MGNMISFRGSYGVQGNIHDDATPNLIFQIGNRDPLSNLDQSSIYRLPNPDLRWEKTKSWNAAVDFSLFDGRVYGSFDVYKKHTSDLIMDKTVASSNGRARLYINAGEMDNFGYEGNIGVAVIRNRMFDWNVNLNFGHNDNKVKLANDDFYSTQEEIDLMLNGNIPVEGEKLGMMYSFDYAGLNAEDGYPMFRGKDGNLYHDGDPCLFAMVKSGSINPDLTGGFDTQLTFMKRLSLSLGFTYSIGGVKRLPSIYAANGRAMDPMTNVSTNWNNRWRKPGDEKYTDIPVLYNSEVADTFYSRGLRKYNQEDERLEYCTYFYDRSSERVASADFLRLRMVGLTYRVPENWLKKVGVSSMMIRLQASNLHVWADKKWQGLDPETPEANIPLLPSFSFGLNVSF